ncbi:DELTA-sagatoxin-Srs1a-like [Alosa pseudoharengus]|uniref:DELTA-sagatoxin-Srs1a-like n=1 Tax=Alosa pseudoharengus TaxID=34774 RepID=UPI003F8924D2
MGNRQCSVKIENTSTFTLCNEMSHSISGFCDDPLPPRINQSETGRARFVKTPDTACGAVGVFTYDIYDKSKNQSIGKIAVMFSNPNDFGSYSNWYALGVFSMKKPCDYELYKEMYYGSETTFVRGLASSGCLTYRGSSVTISATMSDSYEPVLKINVYNK